MDAARGAAQPTAAASPLTGLPLLRNLVQACADATDYEGAAWYARKVVCMSHGDAEDVYTAARLHMLAGEADRAVALLQQHGFIPTAADGCSEEEEEGGSAAHARLAVHATALVSDPCALHACSCGRAGHCACTCGGTAPLRAALVTPLHRLRFLILDAQCYKRLRAWDKLLALLEGGMEGRGCPPLRVPLSAAEDALTSPSNSHASSVDARAHAVAQRRVKDHFASPWSSAATSSAAPAAIASLRTLYTTADGVVTWRIIKAAATAVAHDEAHTPVPLGAPHPVPSCAQGHVINPVSILCALRGDALLASDNPTRATQWFLAAVRCDALNATALQALSDHHLLTDEEETALQGSLAAVTDAIVMDALPVETATVDAGAAVEARRPETVDSMTPSAPVHILTALMSMRMRRYALQLQVPARFLALEHEYALRDDLDVRTARAECLLSQHDVTGCVAITRACMLRDPHASRTATLHYTALAHMGEHAAAELYTLAHEAVKKRPSDALSWYAVGCYYTCLGKHASAVKQYAKAIDADATHAPSWLGLAQAYAGMSEHEQALVAYRTASRLLPASHVPPLAIAGLCTRTGQLHLSDQYISIAAMRGRTDPLVYHEAGVMEYRRENYAGAVAALAGALKGVQADGDIGTLVHAHMHQRRAWEPTVVALAHAYRKLRQYEVAMHWYSFALALVPNQPHTLTCLGFTYHLMGDIDRAIELYHSALTLARDDALAQRLLDSALADAVEVPAAAERGLRSVLELTSGSESRKLGAEDLDKPVATPDAMDVDVSQ